jgi:hypothetical protein
MSQLQFNGSGQLIFKDGALIFDCDCCGSSTCNGCAACIRIEASGGMNDGAWVEFTLNETTCQYEATAGANGGGGGWCSSYLQCQLTGSAGSWTFYAPYSTCSTNATWNTTCPSGATAYSILPDPGPSFDCCGDRTGGTLTATTC